MKDSSKLVMAAAIAVAIMSLLITGTTSPMQSYAEGGSKENKYSGDHNPSVEVNSQIDEKDASQHLKQGNFCC